MLKRIDDMPPDTIGFEAIGEVEDDDWEEQVEPVLRREMADGRKIRLLYLLGPEAREVEGESMNAETGFRARYATSFERVPRRRSGGGQELARRSRRIDASI